MIVTSAPYQRRNNVIVCENLNRTTLNILRSVRALLLLAALFLGNVALAGDFYWVGQTGSWNNASNWAAVSGGNGGAGVPGAQDDVHFDGNSFNSHSQLTISGQALCRNFHWNIPGIAPEITGTGNLTVSGSFHLLTPVHSTFYGQTTFNGTGSNNPVSFGGNNWTSDLTFEGTGGWVLNSKINAPGSNIRLKKGSLYTAGKPVICSRFFADGVENRTLNLGQSIVAVIYGWDVVPSTNLNFNAGNSKIYVKEEALPQDVQQGSLNYNFFEHMGYQAAGQRACNTCGVVPDEFTICFDMDTTYNGYGVTCKDTCDGRAVVTVVPANACYTYDFVGGPTGLIDPVTGEGIWNGVCAGSQIVIITNTCTSVSCATTVNLPDPPRLSVIFSNTTPPTCWDACDGESTALAVGGVPAYTYLWTSPAPCNLTANTATANILTTDTNTLSITDLNGCLFDTTFFLNVPPPVFPNVTWYDVNCNGACDGAAISQPTGGNGAPWTYLWTPGNFTTDSISGLCPGAYTVTAIDTNGCTGDTTINITEPPAMIIALLNTTNLICNGVCTGELEVTTSNGTPPYSYQWYDASNNSMINGPCGTDSLACNLCAGDYYVIVTDANGCQQQSPTYTITEPPAITATASATDVSCNGACDGSISVVAAGGAGGFTLEGFLVGGGSVGFGTPINGLCPGDYYYVVTDATGCTQNSDTVTITEPPAINITITGVNVSCFDSCDGSAMITITGGTPPYTTVWYNNAGPTLIGQSGVLAINLCAGDYFAEVTDANNCVQQSPVQNITQPTPMTITESSTDASCNGVCDGTASVTITGGTPGYNVDWCDASTGLPIGQNGNTATNLCAGDYIAKITDAAGCVQNSDTITVNEPSVINIVSVAQQISCGGVCDGIISLVVTGGTPGYTITWYDCNTNLPIVQTGFNATNLCPGDYYAIIIDQNNCQQNSPCETIIAPQPLTGTLTSNDITCAGFCNGDATIAPTGGTPPYQYEWFDCSTNTTINQFGATASNLCPGDYQVVVTDANNCTYTSPCVTISEPPALNVTLTTTDPLCNGDCNGSATLTINGGTPPMDITWSSSVNTGTTENNLCDGSYTVTVLDANGCDTIINFTLTEPPVLQGTLTPTDPSCNGVCDGQILSNVSGGTPPYTYNWFDGTMTPIGGNTPDIFNLCPDTYTLQVTDANGCTISESATLTDPPGMTITLDGVTPAACGGVCNGEIMLSVSGGTPGYTFEWFYTLGMVSMVPQPVPGEDPTGLCPDDYTVVVTDAAGCTDTLMGILVPTNPQVNATLTVTQPSCWNICDGGGSVVASGGQAPYTYNWENSVPTTIGTLPTIAGLCPGQYSIEVTDALGCTSSPIIFNITAPPAITATTDSTEVTCNGGCDGTATVTPAGGTGGLTIQWGPSASNQTTPTATGLCAGIHNVTITDGNGCFLDTFVEVTSPSNMTITADAIDVLCNGDCTGIGHITSIVGGLPPFNYEWFTQGGVPIAASNNDSVFNLCAGTYYVEVTDANNCVAQSNMVTVNEPPALVVTLAGQVDNLCFGDCAGSATITIAGGTGPYNVSWDDPNTQTTLTAINLCAGTWTATVTDANGCTGQVSATITEPAAFDVTPSATMASCNGVCDGTATVTVNSGGVGALSYQWDDPVFQTTPTAIGLCAGNYQCTITDANNCDTVITVVVQEPLAISITTLPTNPTCAGSCDGQITALLTGGTVAVDYTYLWTDQSNGNTVGTTATVTGLCAGTYDLLVTDDNGCTATASVTLVDNPNMTGTVTTTLSDCSLCNGTGSIVVNGGTPPYNYQWSGPPLTGQGTANVTGLCGGAGNVIVTDSVGCQDTFLVLVSTIPAETIIVDSTDVSCSGTCDGTATVTIVGGCSVPSCTINWYDANAVLITSGPNTITNLCSGLYVAEVVNGAGCVMFDSTFVNAPTPIDDVEIVVDDSCNNSCTGSVTVNPTGGIPPYSFAWSTSANTTNVETGLCAGTVDLTITDAANCSVQFTYTINEPTAIDVSTTNSTDASCGGGTDGTATVFPSGGVPPYTYEWFDCATGLPVAPPQTGQQATNLPAGSYQAVVTDANNCTATTVCIIINDPSPLAVTFTINEPTCNGDCNGSITANVTGGTPNYLYQWLDGGMVAIPGGNGPTLSGLCAGNYFLNITDNNGCTLGPEPVTLTEPAPIVLTPTATDVTCNGQCDGVLDVSITGGVGFISYQWFDDLNNPVAGVQTFNAACAGDYYVVATDVNGCSATSAMVTVNEPAQLSGNIIVTNPACGGDCLGILDATISGGTGPYTIQWYDGSNSPLPPPDGTSLYVDSLCADTYYLEITDAIGCMYVDTAVITEPPLFSGTTITNPSQCGASNGSATANPTGGVPGYTYQWDAAANNQTTQTATGLAAGVYTVTVTDQAGCSIVLTAAVSDINGETLTMVTTPVTCFGDCDGTATVTIVGGCSVPTCTIEWYDASTGLPIGQQTNTATNLCAGPYYVEVTNGAGCVTIIEDTVQGPPAILANEVITNVSCNGACDGSITVAPTGGTPGYTYTWVPNVGNGPTVSNLCAGSYDVTITDANNCDTTYTIVVTENAVVTATTTFTDPSCNGVCDGEIIVVAAGGVGPYTYQWINCNTGLPTGDVTDTLSNACAGDYQVIVMDSNGCAVTTPCVTLTEPTVLGVTIVGTDVTCNGAMDGMADATVTGGTPPYTYAWSPGGYILEDLVNVGGGTYNLIVTDANGCTANASVTINEPPAITATFNVVDATCGLCDGSATVTVGGGVGPYTILWSGGVTGTGPSVTDLCGGTYMVQVTDATGCTASFNVTVNSANAHTVTMNTTDETCFGACDGTASATVAGGTPPYTYVWVHDPLNTTPNETNLCAGTYFLEVTDAAGCIVVGTAVINPASEIIDNNTIVPPTCGQFDGSITVAPTGGTGGYTYNWIPNVTGQGTPNATLLGQGTYTLEITDNSGCMQVFTYNVSSSTAPQVTIAGTNVNCNGQCDGAADATVINGLPPYTYSWTGPGGFTDTNEDITNICAGTYTIAVTDAAGCVGFATVVITEPDTLQIATATVIDASCGGFCDGSINVNVIGGVLPYTFTWEDGTGTIIPGAITDSLVNLCADTYTVTVQDANGCTLGPVSYTVTEPSTITATFNVVQPSCGLADGCATVIPAGGTGPYTYQWYDPLNNPLGTADTECNLAAGTYGVDVTDAVGCTQTFTVNVSNSNAPVITVDAIVHETCFGACDGSIETTISGGTAPYTITWNPPVSSIEDIYNLCPGTYQITVTDAAGCVAIESYVINPAVQITATVTETDASCGLCNGSATVTPITGTPPFSYVWSSSTNTTNTETNLCAGIYTCEVSDANGCIEVFNITISDSTITGETITTTPVSCNGLCDGDATVTAIGGVAPITYFWPSLNVNGQTVTNLCAGSYNVVMTDSNGCSRTATVVITEPAALQDSVLVQLPTCGASDGSINLIMSGGVPGYTYVWTPPQGGIPNPIGLAAGVYVCDVTDQTGCTTTVTVNLPNQNAPTVTDTSTNVTCHGACDGTIDIYATGGLGPYTYELQDDLGNPLGNGQNHVVCAGDYILQVTDANGCLGFANVTITEPDTLVFNLPTVTDVTCAGACDGSATAVAIGGTLSYSYSWTSGGTTSTETGLCAGTETVTVTDAMGCTATLDITITEPAAIVVTIDSQVDPICFGDFNGSIDITVTGGAGGFTFSWTGPNGFTSGNEDLANIESGTYDLIVTDLNGCQNSISVTLGAQIPVIADAGADTASCVGDTVCLVGTGGTSYEWWDSTMTTLLSTSDTLCISPLVGSNNFILIAFDGPCQDLDTVNVTGHPLPNADAGPDISALQDATVVIGGNPTGPSGSTYEWTPSNFLDDTTVANPTATISVEMDYIVTVTSAQGCVGVDTVHVIPLPDIQFPNGITPNGDGLNDTWIIDNIDQFPESVVEIYNRWGELLFRSVGYVEQWDGNYNGEPLPVGTYYYVIDLNDPLYPDAYTGPITILR